MQNELECSRVSRHWSQDLNTVDNHEPVDIKTILLPL